MDTARVDICYRPLRIAWAMHSGDIEAFRRCVRISQTMVGGRFNPIVLADRPEAEHVVELFRADVIISMGEHEAIEQLKKRFPHLISPFFPETLFLRDGERPGHAHVLDIHNALAHWHDSSEWKALMDVGLRRMVWDNDDPLADVFLVHYGDFPHKEETGIDYGDLVEKAVAPAPLLNLALPKGAPIPIEVIKQPGLAYLSRAGLRRHYSVHGGWGRDGYFVGDSSRVEDLVTFWNLRAADIGLLFYDPAHASRYATIKEEYEAQVNTRTARLGERWQGLGVWTACDDLRDAAAAIGPGRVTLCSIDTDSWKFADVRPPMMYLGEESALGVVSNDYSQPRISFALKDKPYSDDTWFHTQYLVASVKVGAGISNDEGHVFRPPYVPELNEFFSRRMHFSYSALRIEPGRIGIVVNATAHDAFIKGLPNLELAQEIFGLCDVNARYSPAGLIARQIIARLGGVNGARVFKIPGVRRLMKCHGPTSPFTKKAALQLIGCKDPDRPDAKFADHASLYIEARPPNTKLTPAMVFTYLVEKDLYRVGARLECPTCQLPSWIALDQLRQKNICEMCGSEYDGTRQLVAGEFHYRRSGVLGAERNNLGSVAVALLLQQLAINVQGTLQEALLMPSLSLAPKRPGALPNCETDFFVLFPGTYPERAEIILGECKDAGGKIEAADINNLSKIADSLPKARFEVFILLAKLSRFTPEEVAIAQTLNANDRLRVILLTERELEPYFMFERTEKETGKKPRHNGLQELARFTHEIYFASAPPPTSSAPATGTAT